MKVSIITAVFNSEQYIESCIASVAAQTYPQIQHIIIDGQSADRTMELVNKHAASLDAIVSAPDNGMYDAINKGIELADGEIVGILNADDMLAGPDVIAQIVDRFKATDTDAVYGDLNYVHPQRLNIIRKWRAGQHSLKAIIAGWMPAHPTFYIRRPLFEKLGKYSLDFGTAADYEFMLRALYRYRIKAAYLPLLMVNMRNGGQSNAKAASRIEGFKNDLKAAKEHLLPNPLRTIILKKLRKLAQFFA